MPKISFSARKPSGPQGRSGRGGSSDRCVEAKLSALKSDRCQQARACGHVCGRYEIRLRGRWGIFPVGNCLKLRNPPAKNYDFLFRDDRCRPTSENL